jgi:hypothetical protein
MVAIGPPRIASDQSDSSAVSSAGKLGWLLAPERSLSLARAPTVCYSPRPLGIPV